MNKKEEFNKYYSYVINHLQDRMEILSQRLDIAITGNKMTNYVCECRIKALTMLDEISSEKIITKTYKIMYNDLYAEKVKYFKERKTELTDLQVQEILQLWQDYQRLLDKDNTYVTINKKEQE